jgi:antitoxin component YwqK of YwqJK toxin-antitoxin module
MRINIKRKYDKIYSKHHSLLNKELNVDEWILVDDEIAKNIKIYKHKDIPKYFKRINKYTERFGFGTPETVQAHERVRIEYYFEKNYEFRYHREEGPAILSFKNGTLKSEDYYKNGNKGRAGAPADIVYYDDGNIASEVWYKNDEKHRTDGPAYIDYAPDGEIELEKFYLNGERFYSQEDFNEALQNQQEELEW